MSKLQELQHLSLATSYEIDNTFDSEKFIKMRLRVCHDGKNPNSSCFVVEDMEKAKDSIYNIPVLANVIFDEDGNPQFSGHDMQLEESKIDEGEYKLIYKETPIGVVPENCNHTISEYNGKNYVFVDCYIWRGYSNYAEDIIERDKEIKLSMEIMVDNYSYNAKEKCYNINDYRYTGITFLNKNYGTGMENALGTTESFNENKSKEKFIMMMEELKETLTQYNINNSKEGGKKELEEKIKLLEKFNLTVDQLDFSIDELSIEELELKLNEKFNSESKLEDSKNDENNSSESEKFIKSFELSHSDIRYALYKLLEVVESEDNERYFIDQVYDNRFEYLNWDGNKIYRQTYKKDGDNVQFEGERIELFQERLTVEEKDALDKMRGDFSELSEKVSQYEETIKQKDSTISELQEYKNTVEFEIKKSEIEDLISEFESVLGENEEFQSIKEKSLDYEISELEKELFALEGKVKHQKLNKNKKQTFASKVSVIPEEGKSNEMQSYYGDAIKYLKK